MRRFLIVWFLVWSSTLSAQQIFFSEGKYGMLDRLSREVIHPKYDTIYVPSFSYVLNGKLKRKASDGESRLKQFYIAEQAGKQAFIIPGIKNGSDWKESDCIYDSIHLLDVAGKGAKDYIGKTVHALLFQNGITEVLQISFLYEDIFASEAVFSRFVPTYITDYKFLSIDMDTILVAEDRQSFCLVKNGKYGLYRYPDLLVEPSYDYPLEMINDSLILVSDGEHCAIMKNGEIKSSFIYKRDGLTYLKHSGILAYRVIGEPARFIDLKSLNDRIISFNGDPYLYTEGIHLTMYKPEGPEGEFVFASFRPEEDEHFQSSRFTFLNRGWEEAIMCYDLTKDSVVFRASDLDVWYDYQLRTQVITAMYFGQDNDRLVKIDIYNPDGSFIAGLSYGKECKYMPFRFFRGTDLNGIHFIRVEDEYAKNPHTIYCYINLATGEQHRNPEKLGLRLEN